MVSGYCCRQSVFHKYFYCSFRVMTSNIFYRLDCTKSTLIKEGKFINEIASALWSIQKYPETRRQNVWHPFSKVTVTGAMVCYSTNSLVVQKDRHLRLWLGRGQTPGPGRGGENSTPRIMGLLRDFSFPDFITWRVEMAVASEATLKLAKLKSFSEAIFSEAKSSARNSVARKI